MAKRKTYPAKNITKREAPVLIWNYDPETGRGPLHISDKTCRHGPEAWHKDITRCGRIMSPDHTGFGRDDELGKFRLCKRCGSESDFQVALAESGEWYRLRGEQEKARRAQEDEARANANAEKESRVKRLASFLVAVGLRVGVRDAVAIVERDGYEYQITEKGIVPALDPELEASQRVIQHSDDHQEVASV